MAENPIRYARKSCGFNQKEFAAAVGVSAQHMSDLETGRRNLSPSLADKIHETLCKIGDWYDGSENLRKTWHQIGARNAGWKV